MSYQLMQHCRSSSDLIETAGKVLSKLSKSSRTDRQSKTK